MNVNDIINKMPDDLKRKAEETATKKGQTLEAYVEEQLNEQLTDEELEAVSGGRTDATDIDLGIRGDYDLNRGDSQIGVGTGIRIG